MKIAATVIGAVALSAAVYAQEFQPAYVRDPWRVFGGKTNNILAAGGVAFSGKVLQVHRDGVRVLGRYGHSLEAAPEREFIVVNFPYTAADGEYIKGYNWFALPLGVESYSTVGGYSRTLRRLDYGIPCDPPATPPPTKQEIAAAKTEAEKKQIETDKATFKFHLARAQAGNDGSQLRVAEMFLQGKGCTANKDQAIAWLKKSAGQGNTDAKQRLAELEQPAASN